MESMTLDANVTAPLEIDVCTSCQAFWFDKYESLKLAPASTLKLMKFIGEHTTRGKQMTVEKVVCPRCGVHLKATTDMQRETKFNYWRCPQEHGRFIRFYDFLREKNFIRSLSGHEVNELRQKMQTVNCSNCGAPVDLTGTSICSHCGSPISMLDMKQGEQLLAQLKRAADGVRPVEPATLLEFAESHPDWQNDVHSSGLVHAGLTALARWLEKSKL
jgi:hypothetical protein